jgi:cytochrome oxidase Cu insertion factor (SCO1/SenC/PrrC family)
MDNKKWMAALAATAIGLGGCGAPESNFDVPPKGNKVIRPPAPVDRKNLYTVLQGQAFMDQDGNSVTMESLKPVLKDKFTTLSFGFKDCGAFCPVTKEKLFGVGKEHANDLVSIVISVNPMEDGATQSTRDAFMQKLRGDEAATAKDPARPGLKQKVIILFAKNAQGELDPAIAPNIQNNFGYIADPTNVLNHTDQVTLFDSNGKKMAQKSGQDPVAEFNQEWGGFIAGGTSQGRNR